MKSLSLFIAKRYLVSKKSHNAINIISWISVAGVAFCTTAFIIVLSVFNGFDSVIKSMINTFEPDLKISLVEGKTFSPDYKLVTKIKSIKGVKYLSEVLEEQCLLQYAEKQYIATIKGVDKNYININGLDSMIVEGSFYLGDTSERQLNYAIIGYGVAYNLRSHVNDTKPLEIFVPSRKSTILDNPANAFNNGIVGISGIFSIQNEFDMKYAIVPIRFSRELLEYTTEVSALEIKLNPQLTDNQIDDIKLQIQKISGPLFEVKNRFEQHELLYKIMKSEKWAIFLILTFILLIASFNIIGSLTMLIIEKKKDIETLRSMGSGNKLIHRIFLTEGWLISAAGAIIGLALGFLLCQIQIQFEVIDFPANSSIASYPVEIRLTDFVAVILTVTIIGYITASYPAKLIIKRLKKQNF